MILTRKQEGGLKIAVQRFKDNELWTCISGYAILTKLLINLEPFINNYERW